MLTTFKYHLTPVLDSNRAEYSDSPLMVSDPYSFSGQVDQDPGQTYGVTFKVLPSQYMCIIWIWTLFDSEQTQYSSCTWRVGYNTPSNELRRVLCFWPVSLSVVVFCQRNSSETTHQNFVKLCSYVRHNVKIWIFAGNSGTIFFLGVMPILNLEIWPKLNLLM